MFSSTGLASIEDHVVKYNTAADERCQPRHDGKYDGLDRVMCDAKVNALLRVRVEDLSSNAHHVGPRYCALEKRNLIRQRIKWLYIAIRNENKGYAVSIVKAGMRAIGRDAGPVRTPLTDLTADQFSRLKKLIETAKPV